MDPHHHHHHHPCHVIPTTPCCQHYYTPPPQNPHYIHQNLTYPNHILSYQNNPFHHHQQHISRYPTEPNDQPSVSSLLRRISALEHSLLSKPFGGLRSTSSLRDAAARTIQLHFRSLLVRRSRALRQLKALALIKSALVELKLSVSSDSRVDYWFVSRKAMDLLLRIDSIQGGDLMIRDGKRSVTRELDRFLQLIDGFSDKINKLSGIGLKDSNTRILYNGQKIDTADFVISGRVKRGSKERVNTYYHVPDDHDEDAGTIKLENFRVLNNGKIGALLKRNGGSAKRHISDLTNAKKNVLVAENVNLSRFSVNTHESSSSEDGSNNEEGKHLSHQKSESVQGKNGGLASRYGRHLVKANKNATFSQNGNPSRTFVDTHESNSSEEGSRDEEGELLDNLQVFGNGKSESLQKRNGGLVNRHSGDLVKAKKKVAFAENRDLSRVFVGTHKPNSSEDGSIDEERELMDNLCRRVQKLAEISKENGYHDQEKAYSEDEESSQISNDEENSKRISKAEKHQVGNENDFAFSAPLPVKMESKADLMKPRKA